ncbi:MAG: porin family protein [Steroidobacteraceae bacterium]
MRSRVDWRAATIAVTWAVCTAPALAADNGLYLGVGITESSVDDIGGSIDLDDTRFKIIAGLRPLDWLGAELNYFDLGKQDLGTAGSGNIKGNAIAAYAVGYLGLDPAPIDLYVKAGLARWELDGSLSSALGGFSGSDDGTEFAYGAGVQARLGSLAARLEYERFDLSNAGSATLYSLGITWTFL